MTNETLANNTTPSQTDYPALPLEKRKRCFLTRPYCPMERYATIIAADIRLHEKAKSQKREYILQRICELKNSPVGLSENYITAAFINVIAGKGNFNFRENGCISGLEEITDEPKKIVLEEGQSSLLTDEIPAQYIPKITGLKD